MSFYNVEFGEMNVIGRVMAIHLRISIKSSRAVMSPTDWTCRFFRVRGAFLIR